MPKASQGGTLGHSANIYCANAECEHWGCSGDEDIVFALKELKVYKGWMGEGGGALEYLHPCKTKLASVVRDTCRIFWELGAQSLKGEEGAKLGFQETKE